MLSKRVTHRTQTRTYPETKLGVTCSSTALQGVYVPRPLGSVMVEG